MTSILSTSSGVFVKSIHGNVTGGVYNTYTQDLFRYQILYDSVITELNVYIKYFATGDYANLTSKFTVPKYNNLLLRAGAKSFNTTEINDLIGFEHDPNKFDLMRRSAYNVIDGLEKTLTVVKQNNAYVENIAQLTYYKNLVENPKLLIEYIESQRLNTMAFQATETFQTQIKLKPWFEEYLKNHGPPGNGVFQSDLLAQIVINLIDTGVITEDEFINS
jgi:hypothetical protein